MSIIKTRITATQPETQQTAPATPTREQHLLIMTDTSMRQKHFSHYREDHTILQQNLVYNPGYTKPLNKELHKSYWYNMLNTNYTTVKFYLTTITPELYGYITYALREGITTTVRTRTTPAQTLTIDLTESLLPKTQKDPNPIWYQINNFMRLFPETESYNEENFIKNYIKKLDKIDRLIKGKTARANYLAKYKTYVIPELLDYINIWAPAYDIAIHWTDRDSTIDDFGYTNTTRDSQKTFKKDTAYILQKIDHNIDDIITTYNILQYYKKIGEPITNPSYTLCNKCEQPIHISTAQCRHCGNQTKYEVLTKTGHSLIVHSREEAQHLVTTAIANGVPAYYQTINSYDEVKRYIPKLNTILNSSQCPDYTKCTDRDCYNCKEQ